MASVCVCRTTSKSLQLTADRQLLVNNPWLLVGSLSQGSSAFVVTAVVTVTVCCHVLCRALTAPPTYLPPTSTHLNLCSQSTTQPHAHTHTPPPDPSCVVC